ncbi:hypothetical protein J1N35_018510 [Gossypium stocksii]|uniref:Reverse transcriptase zinc-binding domain-containing protein n=1 Tax=Gossypium stocksii TaxID=47602 RepID=A0A9D4A6R5_9ROSI|nr:hypothetical protein J1N35_018510 [Gossypium stocksii]
MGQHICNLPIPPYNVNDSRMWLHNPHGVYTSNWRTGHDILPTYVNITCICHNFSTTCLRCNNNEESLIHALKECPKVREAFIIGGLNNKLIDENYIRCIDWLEDILRELDSKAAVDFVTLFWNC